MPAKTDPRDELAGPTYYYRRSRRGRELLPALGVGMAAGLMAFYITHVLLQRTPLTPEGLSPTRRRSRAGTPDGG